MSRQEGLKSAADRLSREIEHHSHIAEHAESIWDWESPAGGFRAERRARLLAEATGLAPGVRALELGCGTGLFLAKAAESGAEICGIDLSDALLARTRARVGSRDNVTLLRGNAERLPVRDGSVDVVFGSSVLHHLDLRRALVEVWRVLKPGGRLAFAEPNLLNPQIVVVFNSGPLRRRLGVSPDEMAFTRFHGRRALLEAGFRDVRVEPFDFVHPSLPAWSVAAAARLGRVLEQVPLLREVAGSLLLQARKA